MVFLFYPIKDEINNDRISKPFGKYKGTRIEPAPFSLETLGR